MSIILRKAKNSPTKPGVYFFINGKKNLYIGKAGNLKKRLSSYFRKNQSAKVSQLIQEAANLKWIETESEIEALLKEAELIKKYRPKYNIVMRDDKSYFYVAITSEKFPKIFITHQPCQGQMLIVKSQMSYIGPFTSGAALKTTLKVLRKVFPYCSCRKPHKRPCLNSQIGRCPGYCCSLPIPDTAREAAETKHSDILKNVGMFTAAEKNYKENINNIIAVLRGKKKKLLTNLKKMMRNTARKQKFEKAAQIRDQIFGLENIFRHSFLSKQTLQYSDVLKWEKIKRNMQEIFKLKQPIARIEGYDISNISGAEATGSMIVFIDGKPAKSEYRKFKIKTVRQISDVDMLKEVVGRRIRHTEWPMPDLMLIDGGKPQLNAALAALSNNQLLATSNSPVVAALAKREEELYIENRQKPVKLSNLPKETAFFFQRVRDESHRFAKSYHHKLRELKFKNLNA